jgi:hypothetical protein
LPPASAILIKFNDAVVEIYTCSSDAGRDAPFRCTRSILVAKLAALSQQRLQGVGWLAGGGRAARTGVVFAVSRLARHKFLGPGVYLQVVCVRERNYAPSALLTAPGMSLMTILCGLTGT